MILILGSGVIAKEINKYLILHGHNVLLTTTHDSKVDHKTIKYDCSIDDLTDVIGVLPIRLIVNCAYSFVNPAINRLIDISLLKFLTTNRDCRCINISSISAYSDAKSKYGQAKFDQEQFFLKNNVSSIRLGLPDTQPPVGLLAIIKKLTTVTPFFAIALSTPGSYTFLTSIEDFSEFLLCNCDGISGVCSFVNPIPMDLVQLTRMVTNKPILPVNWKLLYVLLSLLEFCGIRLRFGKDSLIGLVHSIKQPENNLYNRKFLP